MLLEKLSYIQIMNLGLKILVLKLCEPGMNMNLCIENLYALAANDTVLSRKSLGFFPLSLPSMMLYYQCLHPEDVDASRPKTGTLPHSEFLRAMVSSMSFSSSRNLEVVCSTISGDKLNSRRPKDSCINWSMEFRNTRILGLDLPPVMWSTIVRTSFAQSKYSHHKLGKKVKRDTPHFLARLKRAITSSS
jgi:hypothetical protein